MKERPIIFSGPMVRAILDGSKTQTRRVVKPQPPGNWTCPYGVEGDRLWVRETWAPVDDREHGGDEWIDYKATPRDGDENTPPSHPAGWHNDPEAARAEGMTWRSPIFMPRTASRITLEVTHVRAERVQAISEGDAIAEGCRPDYDVGISAASCFAEIWSDLYPSGPKSWEANPWVWCIEFKRAEAA